MPKPPPLRFRQIHLDFHTSRWIADVGVDFDARAFARTMKAARVDSVTVFAKCHHGHLYYETSRPERHPGMKKGVRLLEQQVEALHREGIRAPIYISVMCDEWAADTHPEWIAMNPDGTRVGRGPLENRNGAWQILDMCSPYQEYLAEQTREILEKFKPVDGIFFDMCWDQPSVSNFAKAEMDRAGLNPEIEADRVRHSRIVALRYMKRFYDIVKRSSRDASVFFNGRGHVNLREEMAYQTQHEIESLPTGGWGYMYFPKNVRIARTLDREYMGMTARFHKSWADFGGLKPYAALEYETAQMLANGARCSIGDQMHPRGTLDKGAYEIIGRAYERVAAREPWCDEARTVTQIAVVQTPESRVGQGARPAGGASEGAVRILTQLKHQFDLVTLDHDFRGYELLILPDAVELDDVTLKRVRAHLKAGGKLLASGTSGLTSDRTRSLLPELGVKPHGMSPFKTTFIRFGKEISTDVPPSDHVMYETGVRVAPTSGAMSLAKVVEPYFDRTWRQFSSHFQTPPDKVTKYAAAVQRGNVGYVAYPVFAAYALHGNAPYRLLVRNLLERLLPEPILRVAGPTSTEATVTRQKGRTIIHLLQYCPERRTEKLDLIEDIVPLFDVPLSLKMAKPPKRVYLAPERKAVEFEHLAGRVNLRVPVVRGHAMIVFE
ncbi:MAG: alpha-amylase family protein [Tepidisphaeraceae bacterium]